MDREEVEAVKVEIGRKKGNGEKLTRVEEVVQAFEIFGFGCASCGGNGGRVRGMSVAVREE